MNGLTFEPWKGRDRISTTPLKILEVTTWTTEPRRSLSRVQTRRDLKGQITRRIAPRKMERLLLFTCRISRVFALNRRALQGFPCRA